MKKFLLNVIMFVCVMISVVLTGVSVYAANEATIYMRGVEFSTTKNGTYYSSKDDLLDNTPEKTSVASVYVKATLEASANGDNYGVKITGVSGLSATYTTISDDKVTVKLGPINGNIPASYRILTVNYSYKYKENNKEKSGTSSSSFTVNSANGFDGTDYGRRGNNPKGEILFELSGGSNGVQVASSSHQVYRYDEVIKLKAKVSDKESQDDIGVKSVTISGGLSTTEELNPPKTDSTIEITTVANKGQKYEEVKDIEYTIKVTDGSGKESETQRVKLSDYVLKYQKIDAEVIPTSTFKPYVKDDEVVIEFKVTYGQEFLKGISNIQAKSDDVYVSVGDSSRVEVTEGTGNYDRVYKVKTKKKPTDKTQSVYLHYETNSGGDGYQELKYELDKDLADGYETTYESNKIQKFDISKGNLWVDGENIAHYGKVISGVEADESTVTCNDIIMITGTTTEYNVKIDKGGKKIIFGKGLSITSNKNDSSGKGIYPIVITGGEEDNNEVTSVVIEGGGKIETTTARSAIYVDKGLTNFYKSSTEGPFKIISNKGTGISVNNGGKISIKQVGNVEITAGGGAGIGTEPGGKGGEVYVMNSPLKIVVTGGGAAIGTATGSLDKVKVEGTMRMAIGHPYYGNNQMMDLKVESGACIGAGNNSIISGNVEVNNIAGSFTVGKDGVAIGASHNGKCGDVIANKLRIKISKNTYKDEAGVGIGAGVGATCKDITVSDGDIEIEECTVGVGADTNAKCGNITVDTEAEIKVGKGIVGIGARDGATMGNIEISSTKSCTQVDLTTTKIGIGSLSTETGTSNIEIKCPNGNYTSSGGEPVEVKISGTEVGIGAADNGKVGNIKINNCNKVLITTGSGGVGIGAKGGSSKITDITLTRSNVWADSCDIGIGGSGIVGKITIENCGKIVAKSSKIGIGSTVQVGDITVIFSSLQMGDSSSKSEIGIGVSTGANMGNINIKNMSNVTIYAKNIGIGSASDKTYNSEIKIAKGSNTHIGGSSIEITGVSDVGIGTTGKIKLIDVKGNSGSKKVSKITIKPSGDGKGIGIGASGSCGNIIVASNLQIGESKNRFKIGIGSSGSCGNIEVREGNNVVNNVVIYASGVGIGFGELTSENSSSTITVRNVKLDISECALGIGTVAGAKVGDINISTLAEVDNAAVDISTCSIKIVPTTSGIGIGGSGTCGNINCTGMPIQIGSSDTKCVIGIGTLEGIVGSVTITSCNGVKIYAEDVGVCSGKDTQENNIKISASNLDINGVNLGIGTNRKLGSIIIENESNIVITPKNDGLGIGVIKTGSTLGEIYIKDTNISVNDCAVGIGSNGECGKIRINGCDNVVLKSNTVGIGGILETSKTGAIILEKSNFKIAESERKSAVGIGAKAGLVGDILIGECNMKIYASDVGIGSKSPSTGSKVNGDILGIITYITKSKIDIEGATVGIGANGGNVGPIRIGSEELVGTNETFEDSSILIGNGEVVIDTEGPEEEGETTGGGDTTIDTTEPDEEEGTTGDGDTTIDTTEPDEEEEIVEDGDIQCSTKIKIIGQGTGVGIGTIGGFCASISLREVETDISDVSIGVGTDDQTYCIVVNGPSKIVINAGDVGIGVTSDNKNAYLNVNDSNVEIKGSPRVGVGTSENGKLKSIELFKSQVKIITASNGVGVGGLGKVSTIMLDESTKADIGGGKVGIGVSGSSGQCDSISIIKCPSILAYGSEVCIGNDSTREGSEGCTIGINSSKVKVAGDGVGIGGMTNGIGAITISDGSTVVANTGYTGVGGMGKCGDISVNNSKVKVDSTKGGAGIGGVDEVGSITIDLSTVDIKTKYFGACIGGEGIGNISINNSNVKTRLEDGIGIGSNSFSDENNSRIDINNSELVMDIEDAGIGTGIGTATGILDNIEINNSVVKINGGPGDGVGIGTMNGEISNIDLTNNVVSIEKTSGSTGAGIGSGEFGNVGNITLTKNKIVVATDSGAGIGSGENGEVTGTITIRDGVIIGKSTNGACIGAGENGFVQYIAIEDGKINARATGTGACIGAGSGNVRTLRIDKGELVCNAESSAEGISASKLIIGDSTKPVTMNSGDINISVSSVNGDALYGRDIEINDGYVEVVSSGANGIDGYNSVKITKGVVKTKGSSGYYDIRSKSIVITRNANVCAYNNRTTGVTRDGSSVVQKRLGIDFWRNYDGIVGWSDGDSSGEIRTDNSGEIYFWYNDILDGGMTFDMAGKRMVI